MRKGADDPVSAGFDRVEKKLIGVMIAGALLMGGSALWYLFG